MRKLKKGEIVSILVILALFAVSAAALPWLPERVASHWDARGQVNGHMSRFWGAFFTPFLSIAILALFLVIPVMDPKGRNIEGFRPYYDRLMVGLLLFMGYVHVLTLVWNLGLRFDLIVLMMPAFAALFYGLGTVIAHAEPNWSVGIRTPWTLSDERVWRRTHQLGGSLYKACGLVSLAGLLFPAAAIWFMLVPLLGVSLFLVLDSYVHYRSLHRAAADKK